MKRQLSFKVYGACIPLPFVVPDGVYIPCQVRVVLWVGFILFVAFSFFKVKNSAEN